MMEDFDPAEALASVKQTQSDVADRVSRGGWLYDTAYSAIVAAMVGAWALAHPANYLVFGLAVLFLVVIMRIWANHHGVWLSGTSPSRARWVAWSLTVPYLSLLLANIMAAEKGWPIWMPVATTSAAFVLALCGSRLWRRVYRRENGLQP